MTEQLLLCLWSLFLLAGLALFVRYEEVSWGEVSPVALLLTFIGMVTIGVSVAILLQPLSYATIVAGLLLVVSVAAMIVGTLARWTRGLAIGATAAFLLALPPSALAVIS